MTSSNDDHRWWVFRAWNQQSHYGYGTWSAANAYCDILNRGRDVGHYYAEMADTETAARLDSGANSDGFDLDLALDAQAEADMWRREDEARRRGC